MLLYLFQHWWLLTRYCCIYYVQPDCFRIDFWAFKNNLESPWKTVKWNGKKLCNTIAARKYWTIFISNTLWLFFKIKFNLLCKAIDNKLFWRFTRLCIYIICRCPTISIWQICSNQSWIFLKCHTYRTCAVNQ